jgi:hypothetical protein
MEANRRNTRELRASGKRWAVTKAMDLGINRGSRESGEQSEFCWGSRVLKLKVFCCRTAKPSGVVDLFGKKPLGLFTKAATGKDQLETWSMLEQREMKLAITHPPSNYFGESIHIVSRFSTQFLLQQRK